MKLGNLFTVNAVIAGLFGLGFIFAPAAVLVRYGVSADAGMAFVAQLFGSALIGFAILTWSARSAGDSDARRAIVLAIFVSNAVGFVLSLMAQLKGLVNSLGWSTVAIYLVLALAFAYFLFAKPSES